MNSNTVVFFHGLVLLNLKYRQKNKRKKKLRHNTCTVGKASEIAWIDYSELQETATGCLEFPKPDYYGTERRFSSPHFQIGNFGAPNFCLKPFILMLN